MLLCELTNCTWLCSPHEPGLAVLSRLLRLGEIAGLFAKFFFTTVVDFLFEFHLAPEALFVEALRATVSRSESSSCDSLLIALGGGFGFLPKM